MFKTLIARWHYRKAMRKFKNRNVTRSKFLYFYFIFGGIGMFLYALSCIFTGFPFIYTFTPVALLLAYGLYLLLKRNWKMIWLFVKDKEQGKFLLRLNDHTHFGMEHKLRLLNWVYLKRRTIRNELRLELVEKAKNGEKLTRKEERQVKYKVVTCPQQLLDGINKAILVSNLIWAHEFIHVLDDDLRRALELTDENMDKFDLNAEINRCRVQSNSKKVDRLTKIGMKLTKEK